jgi:hypothetical protein
MAAFLILPAFASQVLAMAHSLTPRLQWRLGVSITTQAPEPQTPLADWERHYHHLIVMGESFVDLQHFQVAAYKASGWQPFGHSPGFKGAAQAFWERHDRSRNFGSKNWISELGAGCGQSNCPHNWPGMKRPRRPPVGPLTHRCPASSCERERCCEEGLEVF